MNGKFLSCLVLASTATGVTLGQAVDSQQITGTVTDTTGAAIPVTEVTVTSDSTKLSKIVRSNGDGNYVVLNLPVGTYTLRLLLLA